MNAGKDKKAAFGAASRKMSGAGVAGDREQAVRLDMPSSVSLVRLLQLASPTLPVGAYSYSQGLEAAAEAGIVTDGASARAWIGDVLEHAVARTEAPMLLRLIEAWRVNDITAVDYWNALFLASRETSELRAETVQMGYSLARLLMEIERPGDLSGIPEISFPAAFASAVVRWNIDAHHALTAYLWAGVENQVMAAVKAVPLGQTDGQRVLLDMGGRIAAVAERARAVPDDALGGFAPRLAILSSRHEAQYSRLFRS